jgi:hypothetical protein
MSGGCHACGCPPCAQLSASSRMRRTRILFITTRIRCRAQSRLRQKEACVNVPSTAARRPVQRRDVPELRDGPPWRAEVRGEGGAAAGAAALAFFTPLLCGLPQTATGGRCGPSRTRGPQADRSRQASVSRSRVSHKKLPQSPARPSRLAAQTAAARLLTLSTAAAS